ncbi:uncharacterized protein ACIQIH_017832 isoform 1-T1 [Cyanocitta cristata]
MEREQQQQQRAGAASIPAKGVRTTPAEGIGTTPAEGIGTTPAKGAGTTPAEGIGTTPAQGIRTTSADGIRTTPALGAGTTPAEGVRTTPAQGAGTTPADGIRTTPAEGIRTTPAQGAGTTPAPSSCPIQRGKTGKIPARTSARRQSRGSPESQSQRCARRRPSSIPTAAPGRAEKAGVGHTHSADFAPPELREPLETLWLSEVRPCQHYHPALTAGTWQQGPKKHPLCHPSPPGAPPESWNSKRGKKDIRQQHCLGFVDTEESKFLTVSRHSSCYPKFYGYRVQRTCPKTRLMKPNRRTRCPLSSVLRKSDVGQAS